MARKPDNPSFPLGEDCCISEEGIQPAYYRLLLPELLADEERCLYLDGDLVVTRSLTNLYDTPMEGMYLAGITDRLCLEEAQNERMLKDWGIEPGYYINAGVLLMDLGKMRSSGKYMDALELAYRKPFRYLDQDVVNQVYLGKIKLLPKVYQLFPDDCYDDMAFLRDLLPEKAELFPDSALDHPATIHYIGRIKPWMRRGVPYENAWHEAEKAYAESLNFQNS